MSSTDSFEFPIYERITSILFPFSGMQMIDPLILERACARGTAVHNTIEVIQEGLPPVCLEDEHKGYIESYKIWAEGKKFIDKPARFFDDELRITGECDCIYRDEDGLVLVDFKTSANESKTWKYQGTAYSYLAKRKGYDIKRIEFVKLSKEGKAPKTFMYEEDMEHFKILLAVYREFFKGNKYDMGDL